MQATDPAAASQPDRANHQELLESIDRAGELLPMPGPITAFAFLNTLQALEHLPFDEGMRRGARLYGCQPYLTEDKYREHLSRGRIRVDDLAEVLQENLGDSAEAFLGSLGTRFELRLAMLQFPLLVGPAAELRWFVAETDALKRMRPETSAMVRAGMIQETRHWVMRDLRMAGGPEGAARPAQFQEALVDLAPLLVGTAIESWSDTAWETSTLQALWRICHAGARRVELPPIPRASVLRHRDALRVATDEDSDALVHEVLIRFCAAFTDQGFASWTLPDRNLGFFKSFCRLYRRSGGPLRRWFAGLPEELARLEDAGVTPLDSIADSLEDLGVPPAERNDYILATLLALRGWAGMLWQMEVRDDRVPFPVPKGTLAEFLAIRLILDRWAIKSLVRKGCTEPVALCDLREKFGAKFALEPASSIEQRAFHVFQLAQIRGWSPPALDRLCAKEWSLLISEIDAFSGLERRWMFQQAFERRFRNRALDAISIHARRTPVRVKAPQFQVSFCLDAREESFRRHLEETAPNVETFGAPGFYGVAMYYRGVADAHYSTLCPIVVRPKHWVVEDVVYTLAKTHMRRAKTRRAVGTATHQFHVRSRGVTQGAILTAGVGVLATIPLVARVLFPRLTARIRRLASRLMEAPP